MTNAAYVVTATAQKSMFQILEQSNCRIKQWRNQVLFIYEIVIHIIKLAIYAWRLYAWRKALVTAFWEATLIQMHILFYTGIIFNVKMLY